MPTSNDARKPLISGNWKMHHNHFEAITLVQKLSYALTREDVEAVDVSVHPPFTDLRSIQTVLEADNIPIALGAQNCHWEEKGAFTGEVSPQMLAKLNVAYVICGAAGAVLAGALGTSWGVTVAQTFAALVWWHQLRSALANHHAVPAVSR